MKLRHSLLVVCAAISSQLTPLRAAEAVVNVNAKKPGAVIQPTQWGIFFEDINFAADGGLYGELVKNRSFEFTPDHLMGWHSFGKVEVRNDGPFDKNPHYVRLTTPGHRDLWTGLQNEGFFGIGLQKDAEYRFSVWARVPDGKAQYLWIQFVDQNTMDEHQEFTNTDLKVDSREWKKYTVTIKSPRTIARAELRLFLCDERRRSGSGVMDVEHISLFPVDTYRGHENGMRKDVAQALEDLHPGVFRFPGGCIVEGTTLELRYQWKNTVGPVENRPINKNRWENTFTYRYYPDYFQSYGLGFFEYFQLAEEIGAEPLPVLNVGMACQFQNGDDAHAPATKAGLQQFLAYDKGIQPDKVSRLAERGDAGKHAAPRGIVAEVGIKPFLPGKLEEFRPAPVAVKGQHQLPARCGAAAQPLAELLPRALGVLLFAEKLGMAAEGMLRHVHGLAA